MLKKTQYFLIEIVNKIYVDNDIYNLFGLLKEDDYFKYNMMFSLITVILGAIIMSMYTLLNNLWVVFLIGLPIEIVGIYLYAFYNKKWGQLYFAKLKDMADVSTLNMNNLRLDSEIKKEQLRLLKKKK